jgi:hypothetical protein
MTIIVVLLNDSCAAIVKDYVCRQLKYQLRLHLSDKIVYEKPARQKNEKRSPENF